MISVSPKNDGQGIAGHCHTSATTSNNPFRILCVCCTFAPSIFLYGRVKLAISWPKFSRFSREWPNVDQCVAVPASQKSIKRLTSVECGWTHTDWKSLLNVDQCMASFIHSRSVWDCGHRNCSNQDCLEGCQIQITAKHAILIWSVSWMHLKAFWINTSSKTTVHVWLTSHVPVYSVNILIGQDC